MSKKQLEDIKERVLVDRVYHKYLDGTKGHWGKTYTLDEEDYKYLYEQAERVHELEQQNKRYREALKFYAEKDNYEPKHFDPNINNYMSTVDYDEGKKARKALEDEE